MRLEAGRGEVAIASPGFYIGKSQRTWSLEPACDDLQIERPKCSERSNTENELSDRKS